MTGREELLTSIGAAVALDVQEIAIDLPDDALLEAILRKFACHVIFDVHVPRSVSEERTARAAALARRYDCLRHVVLTAADAQEEARLRGCAQELTLRVTRDFA